MPEAARQLIERLFDAVNRRDERTFREMCGGDVELFVLTSRFAGHAGPYQGEDGVRQLFADIEDTWEELLLTVRDVHATGDVVIVQGRIYARSRELGLRDLSVVWLWRLRDGRFIHGRAFTDPDSARAAAGVRSEGVRGS